MNLYENLQKYHNYSDYQIKVVKYALKTFASEISKFVIIGLFFLVIGKFPAFLFSAALFLFLRRYNGGLHCKTYFTCLLASFLYFFTAICLIPALVPLPGRVGCAFLLALTILIPVIAPVKSKYHAEQDQIHIRNFKRGTFLVLAALTILYGIFPQNAILMYCFWITALHFVQLLVAYIKQRRCVA